MKREPALSRANILFCLLVILIHCLSRPVTNLQHDSLVYALVLIPQRLSFVAVPGFFLLSGLKLTLGCNNCIALPTGLFSFYRRRFFRVVVPYLLAVTVYVLFFLRLGWITLSPAELARYYLLGDIAAHFYYVVVLVQFILLTPLWLWIVRRIPAVIGIPASLLITLLCTQYIGTLFSGFSHSGSIFPSYLFFYLSGCYIGKDYRVFSQFLNRLRIPVCIAFILLATGDAATCVLHFSGRAVVPGLNLIHQLYEAAGIFFFLWLLQLPQCNAHPISRLGRVIDNGSYLIYLYHIMFINLFQWILPIPVQDEGLLLLLRILFVYPCSILSAWLWQLLLRHCKSFKKTSRS